MGHDCRNADLHVEFNHRQRTAACLAPECQPVVRGCRSRRPRPNWHAGTTVRQQRARRRADAAAL